MWRASDEFNFTRLDFDEGGGTMGVWDGEKVVFSVSKIMCNINILPEYSKVLWQTRNSWWDIVKTIWRYGYSFKLAQSM